MHDVKKQHWSSEYRYEFNIALQSPAFDIFDYVYFKLIKYGIEENKLCK